MAFNQEISLEVNKREIFQLFTNGDYISQLRESLPKVGITAERMIRVLFSSLAQNPKLAMCSKMSLFNCLIQCAQMGLEPNTPLGHAYLIPYGQKATIIIGYKGLIDLCRRSDKFRDIYAYEVYPEDEFKVTLGTDPKLIHIPAYKNHDESQIIGTYAVAFMKDGSYIFEYMPKAEIEKIRERSKSKNDGPWVTDYMMMARKTAIRRLMHYLPCSIQMSAAIQADADYESRFGYSESFADAFETEQKEESKKKPNKKKTDSSKTEPTTKEKKEDYDPVFYLSSLDTITDSEICAYSNVEDLGELSPEHLESLKVVSESIKSGKMTDKEFKKIALERFEMKNKSNKNNLL